MPRVETYRQSRERIGQLNERVTLYSVSRTRTATGGEKRTYTQGATVWARVENVSATEALKGERLTALNRKRFVFRTASLGSIAEDWELEFAGDRYQIISISPVHDLPRNAYTEVVAERRENT